MLNRRKWVDSQLQCFQVEYANVFLCDYKGTIRVVVDQAVRPHCVTVLDCHGHFSCDRLLGDVIPEKQLLRCGRPGSSVRDSGHQVVDSHAERLEGQHFIFKDQAIHYSAGEWV